MTLGPCTTCGRDIFLVDSFWYNDLMPTYHETDLIYFFAEDGTKRNGGIAVSQASSMYPQCHVRPHRWNGVTKS